MNILITGASGLIGKALEKSLSENNHRVFQMKRGQVKNQSFSWQPSENKICFDDSIDIDAVIHLAGAGIADGRWNAKRKKIILESRETPTRLLSETLAKLKNKPKVFISGSAIGFYGNTGEQVVDETSHQGSDFLADVCHRWETATEPASKAGIRRVNIRLGMVLSPVRGALQKMILPFKMGVGGIIGNGKQYISWVSIHEVVSMIQFIIENEIIIDAVNLVSKQPVTNRTFTKTLGSLLKRPTILPLPAFIARMMFGEMADALLLSGSRVIPNKLENAGYRFIDTGLENTLTRIIAKEVKV